MCNYIPGIAREFDMGDLAGLIAPRPCLLEMGENDDCFPFDYLKRGYEETEKIFGSF